MDKWIKKLLHTHTHTHTIHGWIDVDGILFSHEKEENLPCDNRSGAWGPYVGLGESVREKQIWHDIIYTWSLKSWNLSVFAWLGAGGWRNWGGVVKGKKRGLVDNIYPGELTHNIVIIVNNTVL